MKVRSATCSCSWWRSYRENTQRAQINRQVCSASDSHRLSHSSQYLDVKSKTAKYWKWKKDAVEWPSCHCSNSKWHSVVCVVWPQVLVLVRWWMVSWRGSSKSLDIMRAQNKCYFNVACNCDGYWLIVKLLFVKQNKKNKQIINKRIVISYVSR